MSYETDEFNMLQPEHVNVFGVPFDLALQGDPDDRQLPRTAAEKTLIFARPDRTEYAPSWPRVLRVNSFFARRLSRTARLRASIVRIFWLSCATGGS